ncbi:ABC transporter G family member 9-like [Salvia hispanica]|uniref:ABC transporter G family member 9-like n=1 Tax=Salvia hispanica TaxID=49212 RepID=UPI0020094892|nr:ABC transporter G family member 9-like [Salvia hispanica]
MADLEAQQDDQSSTILARPNLPVTLQFDEVVYKIKMNEGGWSELMKRNAEEEERVILKGISGSVLPGEMLAMLGPSGSGKTTLLTALGGRLGGDLTGTITFNGQPLSNAMKRKSGFVTQDDVLYPHLTVTETLVYTALLRLPGSLTKAEKVGQAEAVIAQLGLLRCSNSIIDGPVARGVSGGERKRVSIGQEMLTNPSVLFLDEPTSGLDSTTAQRIVSTLWELANGGCRTVVMTIHQPSSRIFHMFSKVLLLSDGNPMYFGKGADVLEYFSSLGFSPGMVATNPADFLLDLANGVATGDTDEDLEEVKQRLVTAYKTATVREELSVADYDSGALPADDDRRWSNPWIAQFSILLGRGVKERKYDSFSRIRIVEVLVAALVCGLLWWQSDIDHLQDQVGLLFFYAEFWGFYPMFQTVFAITQERMMLTKERASGMYRLSSYFMALNLNLPMDLVLPTIFYAMTYTMAGLKHTAGAFFSGLFVLLYSVLCTQGLSLAIGAALMDGKSGVTLGAIIVITFLLSSGFFVQHVPIFISWIRYISISSHTLNLLLWSQYETEETFHCTANHTCLVRDFPSIRAAWIGGTVSAVSASFVAMTGMLVFYRLIAYLFLMRLSVPRK